MNNERMLSLAGFLLIAGCQREHAQRCNPLRATNDCVSPYACVYPTAPMCGVSYCCAVDDAGVITDKDPSCQPDPDAVTACMLDLTVAPADAGSD